MEFYLKDFDQELNTVFRGKYYSQRFRFEVFLSSPNTALPDDLKEFKDKLKNIFEKCNVSGTAIYIKPGGPAVQCCGGRFIAISKDCKIVKRTSLTENDKD